MQHKWHTWTGCTISVLYVNSPNACEIAFFMITSSVVDIDGSVSMSLRPICSPIPVSYNIFGTVGFPYLYMMHAAKLK